MLISLLIVLLALAGLINSFYFTFAYSGRVKKSRWIPEILCAREGSNCVTVVQTPYARVFGVPNSLLGIIYYGFVMAWALGYPRSSWSFAGLNRFLQYVSRDRLLIVRLDFSHLLILASAVTVGLGFYLIYALRRKLDITCPLCYAAHAINATLFVLLVVLVA